MSDIIELSSQPPGRNDHPATLAEVEPAPPTRKPSLWGGILLVVVGIAVFGLGAAGAGGLSGWLQFGVVVLGLVLVYVGAGRLLRRRFGPGFDLMAWLCTLWLVILVLGAVFAPWLPIGEHEDIAGTIGAPSMARPDLFSEYPLGTNNFGLDLLARILYGARASLVVALAAVLIGLVVGLVVGIVAGFFRKKVDSIVGIFTNSLLAVPPLILLIALSTVLESNLRNIAFALSLLAIPGLIRMARANTLAYVQREFVLAARAMGATRVRLMMRELLPNVMLPLLSYSMVIISALIVAEASLSFLGLGIQPPEPSWGNMIAEGEGRTFEDHPHIVMVPGTVLFLTVFSFNLLGEKARTRFDPRQGKL